MRGQNSDRLSNLPDALLIDILSLLEAKEVVQTCILSKRWRNLWAFVTSLNFNFAKFKGSAKSFNEFVSCFLDLHDGDSNVHSFKLQYDASINVEVSRLVDKGILYALEHKVKNLAAVILGNTLLPTSSYHCLFTCNSLEQMHLHGFAEFKADSVCLPKLRNLSLYDVSTQDDSMHKLLSGCTTLTTLSIKDCIARMNNISIQSLRSLTVENCYFSSHLCPSVFYLDAPRLEYLKLVQGGVSGIAFKDMPTLASATIINTNYLHEFYSFDFLGSISGLQALELTWFSLKDCFREENMGTTQEIEGFTCQHLRLVEIFHNGSNKHQYVHQLEKLAMQWIKETDGIQMIVTQHKKANTFPFVGVNLMYKIGHRSQLLEKFRNIAKI